ncbi:SprB repeat-containing protein, partial [Flavobacterium sp.]|uniref:SprB repeat-containing protein n=1 Tax=Flavobacterium sp. TaxID=239 RepID=UPI003266260F
MKKKYLFLMMLLVSVTSIFGQTTETFETETAGATTFTDNGQAFSISSQSGGTFSIFDYSTIDGIYGWDGTAPDLKSIDNTNQALIGVPAGFTIKSATGFLLKSFYLLALREDLSPGSGNCVLTGKLSGITQFTVSSSSFNTDLNSMNGFTLIDMTVFGGENNANIAIDELVISTTGSTYETLALDAWKWQKIVTPTVTTTSPATSIGATKAIAGGNVTADGGATVDARGIVWATTTNPTTANNTVTSGTGTGIFSSTLSGLPATTLIYYRAFATNGAGTSYGALASFTTTAALTATQSKTDVSCNGGSNGVLKVNVSGGVGSYTYLWTPGGGTDAIFSGLTAGNYSCLIKDSELTELTKNFTINEPEAITGTTIVSNVSCNGGSNG